jgi:hypothetical protein
MILISTEITLLQQYVETERPSKHRIRNEQRIPIFGGPKTNVVWSISIYLAGLTYIASMIVLVKNSGTNYTIWWRPFHFPYAIRRTGRPNLHVTVQTEDEMKTALKTQINQREMCQKRCITRRGSWPERTPTRQCFRIAWKIVVPRSSSAFAVASTPLVITSSMYFQLQGKIWYPRT